MSTQSILLNIDGFPSSSQQAREHEELEDDLSLSASSAPGIEEKSIEEENEDEAAELMPSTPLDPPDSPPSSPRCFFTPSGSHARMSLALLRSRRTAAREERQRR